MPGKLIVILGPTASGKTDLAIKLATKYGGSVVSADSRQVYKGLDSGSGKITKKEMRGVPHYLLDVANPKRKFTVAQYQKLAMVAVKKIQAQGRVPFLVGGTGFYIQSIVDGIVIPEVKPNWTLREKLSRYQVERLYEMLKKLDPVRARTIDAKNPRRLIRALEIVKTTGKPVPQNYHSKRYSVVSGNTVLQIGIKKSPKELKGLISKRLNKRIIGMIAEVKKIHAGGLSYKRLEELGLEYRFAAQYVQGKITKEEMVKILEKEIWQYAKRQMTWFKRDKKIHWIATQKEAATLAKKFLGQ